MEKKTSHRPPEFCAQAPKGVFFFGQTLTGSRIQRGCFSGGKRFFCLRVVCGAWCAVPVLVGGSFPFFGGFAWLRFLGFPVLPFRVGWRVWVLRLPRWLRLAVGRGGLLLFRVVGSVLRRLRLRVVRLGGCRFGQVVGSSRSLWFCLAGVLVLRRRWASPRRRSVLLARLFLIGIERCWWVGFGSPALFFGGGLVGRCACDRSRCRFCFPLVPVSPALASLLRAVARSAGLRSVPSSLRRVSPGRLVSAALVARVRRLLGL